MMAIARPSLRRLALHAGAPLIVALCGLILPSLAQAAPAPAWRVIGATGPTNLAPVQSEIQRVYVSGEGGTFTLTPTTGEGEGTLSVLAKGVGLVTEGSNEGTVLLVQQGAFAPGQVVGGPNIPPGTTIEAVNGNTLTLSANATGSGLTTFTVASNEVTGLSTSLGAFRAEDAISGAGIAPGTTVASVAGDTLILSQPPTAGGTVALVATETTSAIPFDAEASGLRSALEALPGFGPDSATVVGGPGDAKGEHPYSVTFEGPFTDRDVPLMGSGGGSLIGTGHHVLVNTVIPGGPGTGELAVYATNIGGVTSSGPLKIAVGPLPTGITATAAPGGNGSGWTCLPEGTEQSVLECESTTAVQSGLTTQALIVPLTVGADAASASVFAISIKGGAATGPSEGLYRYEEPLTVSARSAPPGIQSFWGGAFDADGIASTQAGGHPNLASTGFLVNTKLTLSGNVIPVGDLRDVDVSLPPGFIGDPLVTYRCPQSQLLPSRGPLCTDQADLGYSRPILSTFGSAPALSPGQLGVYNNEPPYGYPAEFSFAAATSAIHLLGSVRSVGDYGIEISSEELPLTLRPYGSFVSLFGTPSNAEGKAFLTNATACAEEARQAPTITTASNVWQDQDPDAVDNEITVTLPPVSDCAALAGHFNPGFAFQPESHQAAAPSPFAAHLTIPQEGLTDPDGLVAPELRKAVVALPKGVDVNPSSANGLEACSEAEMGLTTTDGALPSPIRFDKSEPTCPEASKLGTVEAKSPLLEETLDGTIYLADQEQNPFHSLLALYLVIDGQKSGILVKLPGEVKPNPTTGQLTATFDNDPQLPVEDLTLNIRGGGPRSPLATPAVCGTYTTHGELTPWSAPESGPPAQTEDSFQVSGGPGGTTCATTEAGLAFSPSLEAGTTSTQAGAYAPLVIKVSRKDGEQELKALDFSLPKGLTGKLAGIPYCPEGAIQNAEHKTGKAEQASASCPASSQIGKVDTSAGVGSEPIHVGGKVYLAGPYKGAPLSSVVVTPAVAGPFDLGDVVIRAPLYVNPETAEITAKSDPIPTILKGIPLQVRSVAIELDRSGFTVNPTSCNPMEITSTMQGAGGATAKPANRFQVGGCDKLKFKPKLKISLKGSTTRAGHPALKAVVTYPKQGAYANIRRAQVNLPHSEFLDQDNLNKTCTKPVLLEGKCPPKTIYGKAKAWTPLLDEPLEGPVYLVGGYGFKLPALVAELNGQIRVVLKGKVDSGPNKGIRNTFEAVPDAPVSRFVLEMKGGKKYGLLINSENLCKKKQRANVRFTAQNGLVDQTKPLIANQCGKKSGSKKKHGKAKGGGKKGH